MKVLVTGAGGPAGMNVISHSPADVGMVACDADPSAMERLGSRGKNTTFYQVPYARDEEDFIKVIKEISSREEIDLIIPTVDEELLVFSRNRDRFRARVIVSPAETVETCNDKYLFYQRFIDQGFSPRHVVTDKRDDLRVFGNERLFMKPRVGRGSRGTETFENVKEIPEEQISKKNVFCEYLPGYEYTADVLCDLEGRPLVIMPRKRIEVYKGVCVRGRMERNHEIIGSIEKICDALKFIGPINIQFKMDSRVRPKLVEANPRFSGGLPITIKAGVNTPELLYDLVRGRQISRERLEWKEIEASQEPGKERKEK